MERYKRSMPQLGFDLVAIALSQEGDEWPLRSSAELSPADPAVAELDRKIANFDARSIRRTRKGFRQHKRNEAQIGLNFDLMTQEAGDDSIGADLSELDRMIANFDTPAYVRAEPGYNSLRVRPLPIDSLDKIEWIEQVGVEVLEQALLAYPLSLLEIPCRIRTVIPSKDSAIQKVWEEMKTLIAWSDEGIQRLRYSIMEAQLELVHLWYTSGHEEPSEYVKDILHWMCSDSEHPFSSKSLFSEHGYDHEVVATEVRNRIQDRFDFTP